MTAPAGKRALYTDQVRDAARAETQRSARGLKILTIHRLRTPARPYRFPPGAHPVKSKPRAPEAVSKSNFSTQPVFGQV